MEMLLLSDVSSTTFQQTDHDLRTAPLFTRDAYESTGLAETHASQYGVLGSVLAVQ